jgi:hypothetical protein
LIVWKSAPIGIAFANLVRKPAPPLLPKRHFFANRSAGSSRWRRGQQPRINATKESIQLNNSAHKSGAGAFFLGTSWLAIRNERILGSVANWAPYRLSAGLG